MSYRTNFDLPQPVRSHLPEPAQDIYQETFTLAHAAHAGEADCEPRSHTIARAAVERRYERDADGRGIEREPDEILWFEHHS